MPKKTKVLVLSHSSEIGGAELSMVDFFEHWRKKDEHIEPLFIIRQPLDKLAPELARRKFKYVSMPYTSWVMPQLIERPEDIFRNARINTNAVKRIEAIIKNFKPDIVMTNTLIAPWAAFAAKLNQLPHVWFVREYGDKDHGHSFELGRRETFEDIDLLSDMVVTNSKTLGAHVKKYVTSKKVETLYTPFDVEKIKQQYNQKVKNPFSGDASIKAIIVGAVRSSKHQDLAIEAIAKLRQKGIKAELCVVGHVIDPEYLPKLKRDIKKLGITKSIHFVGKQANPYAYARHADVGIMASNMEAFGRVTFEYLTLGIPVIGAADGGTLEMVRDDTNGFLFKPGSAAEMAKKLERYTTDPALLKKHGVAAGKSATGMIGGPYGADALIAKIKGVIRTPSDYRLPHFTHRWLNIPTAVDGITYGSGILHLAKKVVRLGPKGTYHRSRHKIGVRVNKVRKKAK